MGIAQKMMQASGKTIKAWDLSTATFVDQIDLTSEGYTSEIYGLSVSNDGTKMVIHVNDSNPILYGLTLSTAWDLTTSTLSGLSTSTSFDDITMRGLYYKPDGTMFFTAGNNADRFHSYQDQNTGGWSGDGSNHNTTADVNAYTALTFADNGLQGACIETAGFGADMRNFTVSSAWTLSNFTLTGVGQSSASSFQYGDDGKILYTGNSSYINQYELTTPYDIDTQVLVHENTFLSATDAFYIDPTGTKLFTAVDNIIKQYKLG